MLYRVICLGDYNTHGGRMVAATDAITINGKPVVLVGHTATCPIHKVAWVLPMGSRYIWMGREVCTEKHILSCGCYPIASQSLVRVGDEPHTITASAGSAIVTAEATSVAGSETAGILKRYANAATLGAAFPEQLTAAEEKGIGSKVRDLYGGNDTIQNEADIAAYNNKPSSLGVKHGQIFDAAETSAGVLGVAAGGLGVAGVGKNTGAAAGGAHPGLHNRGALTPDVPRGSFRTLRKVDMENLSPADKAARNALRDQQWQPDKIKQILQSGDDFKVIRAQPGDKLYGFDTAGRSKDVETSAYWLDEAGYKDVESKFLKEGSWDKEGLKNHLALPCYNRANTISAVEVTEETTFVQARVGKATELIQYSDDRGYTTGIMGKIMGGGGLQSTAKPSALQLLSK